MKKAIVAGVGAGLSAAAIAIGGAACFYNFKIIPERQRLEERYRLEEKVKAEEMERKRGIFLGEAAMRENSDELAGKDFDELQNIVWGNSRKKREGDNIYFIDLVQFYGDKIVIRSAYENRNSSSVKEFRICGRVTGEDNSWRFPLEINGTKCSIGITLKDDGNAMDYSISEIDRGRYSTSARRGTYLKNPKFVDSKIKR
jgi:hypothetical protein